MKRPFVVLAVALLMALGVQGAAGVRGQDATPTGFPGEAIDPAGCRVDPIPAEKLIALWYPANETGATAAALPEADAGLAAPLPLGAPADAATAAEIHAAVRELFACQNRVENGRFYALLSDDMLRGFGPPPDTAPEDVAAHLAPFEPIPAAEFVRLLAVTDVSVMADGRVGALVVSDDPPVLPEGPQTALMVFVEEQGRWLVDEVIAFTAPVEDEATAAPAGTPIPATA